MVAPDSIIGRTVAVTIRQAHTRCTAPPGTVIHYYFEDADTVRGVRPDGIFDHPTMDCRSEIELAFSAADRGTFEQRDFAPAGEVYWGDVTTLHYRGDFEVQLGPFPDGGLVSPARGLACHPQGQTQPAAP